MQRMNGSSARTWFALHGLMAMGSDVNSNVSRAPGFMFLILEKGWQSRLMWSPDGRLATKGQKRSRKGSTGDLDVGHPNKPSPRSA